MQIQSISAKNYCYKNSFCTKTNQTFKGTIYMDTQGYSFTDDKYNPIETTFNMLKKYGITKNAGSGSFHVDTNYIDTVKPDCLSNYYSRGTNAGLIALKNPEDENGKLLLHIRGISSSKIQEAYDRNRTYDSQTAFLSFN